MSIQQPAVSIIMPVYNCEVYLRQAINSILNQTLLNWEAIIIDDGSTDQTFSMLQQIQDSRFKIFRHSENKGLAACLNEGIDMSSGKYIVRMDGDDVMFSDRLENQLAFMNAHPHVDVSGGEAVTIDEHGRFTGFKKTFNVKTLRELAYRGTLFIHPTVMAKAEWFRNNKYDAALKRCQDYDLWIRSFEGSAFSLLEKKLIFYREVAGGYKEKYYRSYVNTAVILRKNHRKFSLFDIYFLIGKAYFKYFFFDVLCALGLLSSGKREIIEDKQLSDNLSKEFLKAIR